MVYALFVNVHVRSAVGGFLSGHANNIQSGKYVIDFARPRAPTTREYVSKTEHMLENASSVLNLPNNGTNVCVRVRIVFVFLFILRLHLLCKRNKKRGLCLCVLLN